MGVQETIKAALANGITYDTLIAYIDGLHAKGELTDADYNQIILYILANGNLENSPRDLIQVRRGNYADLPMLAQGEPGFCLDTDQLYVGGLNGNVAISGSNPYKGKSVLILGDSISSPTSKPFEDYEMQPVWSLNMQTDHPETTITINAVGGRSISGSGGMAEVAAGLSGDFDYIIIEGGVNDYFAGVPIGSETDDNVNTFNGALAQLFVNLEIKFPYATKILVTPFKTTHTGSQTNPMNPLSVYVAAMGAFALRHGWPLIDVHSYAPLIQPENTWNREHFQQDGCHPNATYAKIFAEWMWAKLTSFAYTGQGIQRNGVDISSLISSPGITTVNTANIYVDTHGNANIHLLLSTDFTTAGFNVPISSALPEWCQPAFRTPGIGRCIVNSADSRWVDVAYNTNRIIYLQTIAEAGSIYDINIPINILNTLFHTFYVSQ